ncbi:TetR/AcrR family transcriptional regulator [Streptacidiphilus sp. P02-A3a]|uniref:TetR/AcrR family transcriptional regulator n=1 Tax=Streptacidiphilus sp. P02-A3a TaxID=2704468 RepID=UPI0015FBE2B3|nr:TetR/AcrR family transcriptional regulator [Streptacidiphilus sp. P02-A3a]QMU68042.1 TetR/AcrR family transcriptional regulator [Streptacidiphilus sp. P02-A3a]
MTDDPARPAPTGSTKALRRDAEENRQRLLRAAWEVFAELGPEAGVEEIARRAGVGMGTLYRRFPTKEALVLALNDALMEELLEHTRQTLARDESGAGLEECLWFTGKVMSAHQGCLSRLWQGNLPSADPRRQEHWAIVRKLLERAQEAGRVRADLTLTDVYLAVLALRGLVEETGTIAPEAWMRFLEVQLAGFRPAITRELGYTPADDALVRRGVGRWVSPPHED